LILVGDVHFEVEFQPKLPENVTPVCQDEIMKALRDMLQHGKAYSGTSEAQIEWARMPNNRTLVMKVRMPSGRIEFS
jgi:hypothetical protein